VQLVNQYFLYLKQAPFVLMLKAIYFLHLDLR